MGPIEFMDGSHGLAGFVRHSVQGHGKRLGQETVGCRVVLDGGDDAALVIPTPRQLMHERDGPDYRHDLLEVPAHPNRFGRNSVGDGPGERNYNLCLASGSEPIRGRMPGTEIQVILR